MHKAILVIPAEGDSVDTEKWYVEALKKHYKTEVFVLEYNGNHDVFRGVTATVMEFFREHSNYKFEVHAQGGFGAYVAYCIANLYSENVGYIFFIGGAPFTAMTQIALFFHRVISRLWYFSTIPYFADDPNPNDDIRVEKIRESSTMAMRADPKLYCNQLVYISKWRPAKKWRLPGNCIGYFVPNGDVKNRPKWWDNTYNNTRAIEIWKKYKIRSTAKPGKNFSFYSMMPAEALFDVLDGVRTLVI